MIGIRQNVISPPSVGGKTPPTRLTRHSAHSPSVSQITHSPSTFFSLGSGGRTTAQRVPHSSDSPGGHPSSGSPSFKAGPAGPSPSRSPLLDPGDGVALPPNSAQTLSDGVAPCTMPSPSAGSWSPWPASGGGASMIVTNWSSSPWFSSASSPVVSHQYSRRPWADDPPSTSALPMPQGRWPPSRRGLPRNSSSQRRGCRPRSRPRSHRG